MVVINYTLRSNVFSKFIGMFSSEPKPPVNESYTAKAVRVLSENDFMHLKTTLRIEPHFKYQDEVVVKLHPKILRAANELFPNEQKQDLTFMLVPISAKATDLIKHIHQGKQ